MKFPKDFLWGSATSSYQIEGSALIDGRGECIWHRFSHTPGKVYEDHNGDVACDHYHRYQDDVDLMKHLGLNGYRFSTAWARVIPQGTGEVNEQGLDFYDRLVDSLLAADIQPFVTLYHWDLPQALQDQGGWANSASPDWFAEYADVMTRRLGDRIKSWTTFNEPWVVAFVGNLEGRHAPGNKDMGLALQVAHQVLLAHGKAAPVIRQNVPDAQVGIVLDQYDIQPANDSAADKQAVQLMHEYRNLWFMDPVFNGYYPANALNALNDYMGDIDPSEIKEAQVDIDFLGVNYYTRNIFTANADNPPFFAEKVRVPDVEHTQMNWEVYPDGLYNCLVRIQKEYNPNALYVTENGAAFPDQPPVNGVVEDPRRVAYLEGHFDAASRAIEDGVALKGYFVWSFLDNFEWAFGYEKRFGIIYVDFETLKRTPKQSALYLKDVIANQV